MVNRREKFHTVASTQLEGVRDLRLGQVMRQTAGFLSNALLKKALFALACGGILPTPSLVAMPVTSPIDHSCRQISIARLPCHLKRPIIPAALDAASRWKLARAKGARDGEQYVSIIKTADTLQSDPDFAGLMIRCAPKGKIDVLVALIQPFPPQSHPQVTIGFAGKTMVFEGSMAAAGAAVILPDEAANLVSGPWQMLPSLTVDVEENKNQIKGVVALDGLKSAYNSLVNSCAE